MLYRLEPTEPPDAKLVFWFAGRPTATLAVSQGIEEWRFLTVDHLGTPVVSTMLSGNVKWSGGFEPFGRDWQEGTLGSAERGEVFLRLPGQWVDEAWEEASSGVKLHYNLFRWLEPGLGRYTRQDPLRRTHERFLYGYAAQNPLRGADPLGLFTVRGPAPPCLEEYVRDQLLRLASHPTIPANLAAASGASLPEVMRGFVYGAGPEIVLERLPESPDTFFGAYYFGEIFPQEIRLAQGYLERFCACPCDEGVVGLGITILHEYAHYLHYHSRGAEPEDFEAGDAFTRMTYSPATYGQSILAYATACRE
jgi:RHS repeat-associated protein